MTLYRRLLRLYPRWFRDRYREELAAAFAEERAALPPGPRALVRFWLHILADLIASAARLRFAHRRPAGHHSSRNTMDTILHDLRHAVRSLVRRPAFTAVAVLSLALGIGGNAVILAFVDGFVLHPFPYPEPDRVVTIGVTFPRMSDEERFIEAISPAEFLDLRRSTTVRSIAAFDLGNRNISGGDRPERVVTGLAVTDPFAPFGLAPALGRGFTDEELAPGGPDVAILSYRLWQGRFGGDPSMVGRSVRVNGVARTVVGIMPAELLILGVDLWIPWGGNPAAPPRTMRLLTLVGRLAPAASLADANAELATIAAQISQRHAAEFGEYVGWRVTATPWVTALMRDVRPGAQLLLGAVVLVLLIACANLSNLLLARATTRQHEIAVRLALGAGRGRIARLLLAEIALIAAAGSGLGLLLAYAGLPALVSLVPPQANTLGVTAAINARVVVWTSLLTIGSAVLIALLPVFQATRTDPHDSLRSEGRGATSGRAPFALRHGLVVVEIALSVMLLVGAGLMIRSFVKLSGVEPGFEPGNVLTMRLTLPNENYRGAAIPGFFQQLVDRLEQVPGVHRAAAASQFPPQTSLTIPFRVNGIDAPTDTLPTALITETSEKLFATLGVPVVSGRGFGSADRAGSPFVAVVNQAFAARFLPGVEPIGRTLSIGPANRPSSRIEIVGVAANTQNQGLSRAPSPEIFVPMHQHAVNNQLFLLVRTAADPAAMLPEVRKVIASLDPDQPVYAVRTLQEALAANTFRQRVAMVLLGIFAAVAAALAAIGIFGVMSYAVSARTQEFGVRLAVGADRGDVVRLVLRQVVRLTALGLAIGVGAALAAGGAIRGALYGVRPSDPLTLAAVALVLASVALLAGWIPAWRASRVDPVNALRAE